MEHVLEAEADAVGVDTAEGERLVDGLGNQGRRVLLMHVFVNRKVDHLIGE
jgi:hypothetical protein